MSKDYGSKSARGLLKTSLEAFLYAGRNGNCERRIESMKKAENMARAV